MEIFNQLKINFKRKIKSGILPAAIIFSLVLFAGSSNILPGARATDDRGCELNISAEADKASAEIGDTLTYTLSFSNSGSADCTGGGVRVEDIVDSKLIYKSETHSDNVMAGYDGAPVYDEGTRTLVWDADDLVPGESGFVSWSAVIDDPETCGDFDIANIGRITSWEYSEFSEWVDSNTVHTAFSKLCPTPSPTPVPSPVPPEFNFPLCETLLAKSGDKAHYETGWHQIVGGPLLEGSDDVYSLEGNNYTQCFCPLEGDEGIQSDWLRADQAIDGWFFENGVQWDLGDFNYAVKNSNFNCQPAPVPTPTQTPSPVLTPTPAPISAGGGGGGYYSIFIPIPTPEITPSPALKITKIPYPSALPAGGGQVTYTHQVFNKGNIPFSSIVFLDDKCDAVNLIGGDADKNSLLDIDEVWTYTCQTDLKSTTTNNVTVRGEAGGMWVTDTASATVRVGEPVIPINLPKAGSGGIFFTFFDFLGEIISSVKNLLDIF